MRKPKEPGRRRNAAEWSQLIGEWKRSGLRAAEFAAARGVVARTLTWWSWRLAQRTRSPAREKAEPLRLVPVDVEVERVAAAAGPAAWEVVGAGGDVLRVYRGIERAELEAVLRSLTTRGAKR